MIQRTLIVLALVCVIGASIRAIAGIPEPDVILYGSVCINGVRQQAAQTDVVVEAAVEVEGSPRAVGRYRMGDSEQAGDSYVLRIQRESGIDGSAQSSDAAWAGQRVRVAVQVGHNAPIEAVSFTVDDPGTIRRLDLVVGEPRGIDGDGDADLKDFAMLQRCFRGSGAGTPGPECAVADHVRNGDVDLLDYQAIARVIAGPCN